MAYVYKNFLAYWGRCRQKGQILVFTAVLLPLMMAALGFTVDFGNMYMHKSRLQNAADAAAIAGAYAYRDHNNKPGVGNHDDADDYADFSVQDNLANWRDIERIYQVRVGDDGTAYYRALLTEEVPVYFLRLFGVGTTVDVAADSIASIATIGGDGSNGGTIFDNLFSFGSDGFKSINANQNPDNAGISSIGNSSFYHGRVVGIGADANMKKDYTHELLDTTARDGFKDGKYKYVKEAIADGAYVKLEQDKDRSLDEQLKNIMAGVNSSQGKEYKWDNGIDVEQLSYFYGINYIYNKNGINPEVRVNAPLKKLKANDDTPLYIVCDTWAKLTLNSKTVAPDSRPIVFVYTGTGTINIEANNAYFRGIIYAPNASVHINDDGMTFYGSIAAKGLEITGKGTYIHENLLGDSGSGSGNAGTGGAAHGKNTVIGLTAPPDNISWQ